MTDCESARVPGRGSGNILVVFPYPVHERSRIGRGITDHLSNLPPYRLTWARKCEDPDCVAHYAEVREEATAYEHVLALGAEPWKALTNKGNITRYRGRFHEHVFPTINPSAAWRNPSLLDGFQADVRNFARAVSGGGELPHALPRNVEAVTPGTVGAFRRALQSACESSFDIETTGEAEFLTDAAIVSLAVTLTFERGNLDTAVVYTLPLYHPESPFRDNWREVLLELSDDLCRPAEQIAHNGKYDCRWLHHFGVPIKLTFDTIMATALLNENERKSLKVTAERILGAEPWAVDTGKLLDMPLSQVLEYNGLDTWHTLRLKHYFERELRRQPKLYKIFTHISMPAVRALINVERAGVWVDQQRLAAAKDDVARQLVEIEMLLMEHVPARELWPADIKNVNFNASKFSRWWLFEHLGFPVLAVTKTGASMSQHLLKQLADGDNVPALLVRRTKLVKLRNAFYNPWTEQLTYDERIHTTFKPWGTVTGRLSSGKEGADK